MDSSIRYLIFSFCATKEPLFFVFHMTCYKAFESKKNARIIFVLSFWYILQKASIKEKKNV